MRMIDARNKHLWLLFGLAVVESTLAAGLIDDKGALISYSANLSITLAKAAGSDGARLTARGFVVDLEAALKEPVDRVRIVDFPQRAPADIVRVIAVVPPQAHALLPIPVCAEQHNKVLGTWEITAAGDVSPVRWDGAVVSESPRSSACKAFIFAKRAEIISLGP